MAPTPGVERQMADIGEKLSGLTSRFQAHEAYEETRWQANDRRWQDNADFLKEFRQERKESVSRLHERIEDLGSEMKSVIHKSLVAVISILGGCLGIFGGAIAWLVTHYMLK